MTKDGDGDVRERHGRSASNKYRVKSMDVGLVYDDGEARSLAEIQDLSLEEGSSGLFDRGGVNPVMFGVGDEDGPDLAPENGKGGCCTVS